MRTFQFDFQPDSERLFHKWQGFRARRVKMFHEHLAVIDGIRQSYHAGGKHVAGAELTCSNNGVPAYDVGHQAAHLLIISDVIACQLSIRSGELRGAHPHIALIELRWV